MKSTHQNFAVVWDKLKIEDRVLIFGHKGPDGDALGSTLAFSHILKYMGIDNTVIMPNAFPESFNWMPGSESILTYETHKESVTDLINTADWLFFLDFNATSRLGDINKHLKLNLNKTVIIDHHPDPTNEVALLFSDTNRSSTCELLYSLLVESGKKHLMDGKVATCIFTGMITDTGGFNHNSESAAFFHIIADLIELGANKDDIYRNLFHTQKESRIRLLGKVLNTNLELNYKLGVAILWLDASDLKKYDFSIGDTEGFVNMPLSIEGINKSVFVMEMPTEVKLSFRSRKEFSINEFAAQYFNGGGHKNAAGGTFHSSFNEAMLLLKSKIHLL